MHFFIGFVVILGCFALVRECRLDSLRSNGRKAGYNEAVAYVKNEYDTKISELKKDYEMKMETEKARHEKALASQKRKYEALIISENKRGVTEGKKSRQAEVEARIQQEFEEADWNDLIYIVNQD